MKNEEFATVSAVLQNKLSIMNNQRDNKRKRRVSTAVKCLLAAAFMLPASFFTSCSDMLEPGSDLVEFAENNTLNHATDSVYSVMGIINGLQTIADRTVLLGSARGDLMTTTGDASTDLKKLAAFNFTGDNKYNEVSDYYAIINNCNYFIAHIDTAMQRRGRTLFMPEYAAVKSYRAWTYLQLALNYGEVPLVLQPLMTEKEALEAMKQPRKGIKEICETFIADLTPYVGINLPDYKNVNGSNSQDFFIPMRPLLGDLCLWAGRYQEAAYWYHDFLTDKREPIIMSNQRITWPTSSEFVRTNDGYSATGTQEVLSYIPMEVRVFDGTVSDLPNIYNSTTENYNFFQLTASKALARISAAQIYCFEEKTAIKTDTIYAPRSGFSNDSYVGDLRYVSNFRLRSSGTKNEFSEVNSYVQTISKINEQRVPLYRVTMLYLRYAEALNRAGYPQSAFAVLKYGMCDEVIKNRIDSVERSQAGDLIYFDPSIYRLNNDNGRQITFGVHSLGSGDSHVNAYYTLPQPATELASRQDTVNYQIPLVEDMIVTEMALEGMFEGNRFYDLMRVALRRNNPAYLAEPISLRDGEANATLRQQLLDPKNWYLPLP